MVKKEIIIDGKKYVHIRDNEKCIYIEKVDFKTINEESDTIVNPFEKLEIALRSLEPKSTKQLAKTCISELKRRFNLYD